MITLNYKMRKIPDISEYKRTISSLKGAIVVLENEKNKLKKELVKYEANATFVNVMGLTILFAGVVAMGYITACLVQL